MTVILQGSLRRFPPWQLLPFLVCSVESATLSIGSSPVRLYFRGARAVAGESPEGNDAVTAAAMLLSADGAFFVDDEVRVPSGLATVDMEISELLEEAGRCAREMAEFPSDAMFRVVDDPKAAEKISLTQEEFRLVFKIGSGHTVGELVKSTGMARTALVALLRNLEGNGLVTREAAQTTAPVPPPVAPPPVAQPQVAAPPPPPPPFVTEPSPADTPTQFLPSSAMTTEGEATVVEPSPWLPLSHTEPEATLRPSGVLASDGPDGAMYPLLDDEYTVGREAGNKIVIGDASISSHHAVLSHTSQGWMIRDLGSRNGTYVNGEAVTGARPLANNDVVRLGKVILTFRAAGGAS